VFGDLSIVASQDIGPLGPREGTPVVFHWNLARNVARISPWLALAVLLGLKPNRRRGAWSVLLPIVALEGVLGVVSSTGFDGGSYMDIVNTLILALAALWLLSYRLQNVPQRSAFRGAAVIMIAMSLIGILGPAAMAASSDAMSDGALSFLVSCLGSAAILIGFGGAGLFCRKQYTPGRFMAWLFISLVALTSVCILLPLVFFEASIMASMEDGVEMGEILFGDFLLVLGAAIGFYILLLPFALLALWNPTYRQRFYGIFRLPGMEGAPVEALPLPESAKDPLP
jgi:hypothetical protein